MRTIGLWKRVIPAILILATVAATAEAQLGRKYALLVGVKQYRKSELRDLPYSEPDVTALADVLRDAGYFRVVLMTQTEGAKDARFLPTSENIRISLKGILDQRSAEDSVLVAFAGHGVQFRGADKPEAFFCPMDARLNDKGTLLSFSEVYNELGQCDAGFKLLLVDACRNQPAASVTRAREVVDVPSITRPPSNRPKGLAAFYSCSSGQVAFESEQLRHGVFFHFVLESLRGKGDLNRNGLVELEEMALYTKTNVWDHVKIEYGDDVQQMPELVSESSGVVPLIKLANLEPVEPPQPPRNLPNVQIVATLKSDNGLVEIGLPQGWVQQ
ncbi:MAG: caspase family protein, partial [Planctomycetaceae bacterium]